MKTEIIEKNDTEKRKEYETFVSAHRNGHFMQSLKWPEVKSNWEYETVIVRDDNGRMTGGALMLVRKLPVFGQTVLYAPHGPVCDYNDGETMKAFIEAASVLAKKHKSCMFRMDPRISDDDRKMIDRFKELGFVIKEQPAERTTFQSRNNYVLDLEGRTKEEVLANFHQKWRYNIRVAGRKGVECINAGAEKLDDFYPLMQATGIRDGFSIRPKEYFRKMLDALGDDHCRLYMCYKDGVPLSGAIATQYAGVTSYVYGASSNESRNLMPNYLMQWTMIQWAMDNDNVLYDFLGIPFYYDENNPSYGVYRFKKGFNGRVLAYAGEFDYIFKPVTAKVLRLGQYYAIYRLKKIRKSMQQRKHKKSS